MAVMDEFKSERESIKQKSLKEKLSYFWTYYKWFVITPLIILLFFGNFVYEKLIATESVLNGVILNVNSLNGDSTDLLNGFYEAEQIDQKEYNIELTTTLSYQPESENASSNYTTLQALLTWQSAGMIDFICGDQASMQDLAYKGYFVDLSQFLTAEELAKYESKFLYMDQSVIEKREAALGKPEELAAIVVPACDKPEEMEKPVPVLLSLTPTEALSQTRGSNDDNIVFGIVPNIEHKELALKFIKYATLE